MSVQRTPPETPTNELQVEPELVSNQDDSSLNLRKRKIPNINEDIKKELADFRKEILSILKDFTNTQNSKLSTISNDVVTIKQQMRSIEQKTDNILLEQSKFKNELSQLKTRYSQAEKKIVSLEDDIKQLKLSTGPIEGNPNTISCREDIISEMKERSLREKNLIISGIPESNATDRVERLEYDTNEVIKIIKNVDVNTPYPTHCMRLGKYQPNKARPIKVIFALSETAKNMLKKRSNNTIEKIKIYSDNTIQQQKYLNLIKEELNQRKNKGENNITIKYIRGVPKIVDLQSKN